MVLARIGFSLLKVLRRLNLHPVSSYALDVSPLICFEMYPINMTLGDYQMVPISSSGKNLVVANKILC